jgi:hypothetical protein
MQESPLEFAGLTLNEKANLATVYVKAGGIEKAKGVVASRAAETLKDAKPNQSKVNLEIAEVTHSRAELEAVLSAATSDPSWLSKLGVDLRSWYIDPVLNAAVLGVSRITPQLLSKAEAISRDALVIQIGDVPELQYSRDHDTEPFGGGIRATNGSGGCSLGFSIMDLNHIASWQMLSAGHCWDYGDTIVTRLDGLIVGDVVSRQFPYLDFSRIAHRDYYWGIYGGNATSTTLYDVKGDHPPVIGEYVCSDGGVTGEICGWVVGNDEVCATFSSGTTTCHLTFAYNNYPTMGGETDEERAPIHVSVSSPQALPIDQVTATRIHEKPCTINTISQAGASGSGEKNDEYVCWEDGGGTYVVRVHSGAETWTQEINIQADACHTQEVKQLTFVLDPQTAD